MNILDMKTVIFSYVISNGVCLIAMALFWLRNRERFAGLGFWLADYAFQFLAILLVAMRGRVPDFFSILVSNGLVIAGTILLLMGLERFVNQRTSQIHNYLLLGVFLFIHAYFTFVQPSLLIRTVNLSAGIILICAQCTWLLIAKVDAKVLPIARGVGSIFVAFCLLSLARIIVLLMVNPGNDFFQSGPFETLATLTNQMLFIILTFGLLLLVNRRLVGELESDIIGREQAEAALKRNEALLLQTAKIAKIGGWELDLQTMTPHWSQETYRIHEVDPSVQPDLDNAINFYAPEARPAIRGAVQRAIEQGQPYDLELPFVTAKGKEIWVRTMGEVEFRDGKCVRLFGTFQDITERKQFETILRKRESILVQAGEIAHLGAWDIELGNQDDINANPLYWSDEVFRIFGYAPGEVKPSNDFFIEQVHPDDRERIQESIAQAIATQQPYQIEHRIYRPDGEERIVYEHAEISFDEQGKPIRIVGAVQDITERKQAEEGLRRYQLLSEYSRDIILFIRREDGRILEANAAAAQAYGYSHDELLALTIRNLRAQDTLNLTPEQMAQADAGGLLFETVHKRKDGSTFTVEVSSKGATIGGVRMLISIVRDITERKQVEEEITSLSKFPTENPYPVLRVQNNGRLNYANAASQELLEMWGCEVDDYLPEEFRQLITTVVVNRSKKTVDVLGKDKIYSFTIVPIPEGGYVNLYGSDITKRKQVEQALFESEEKYRLLAEHANDWIYWIRPDRGFRHVSPSCERVTGYAPLEFMNNPRLFIDIIHPEDRDQMEAHLGEVREGAETHNLDYRIITKTNEVRWISHSCDPVYSPDGKYMGRNGTNRDITARKLAEATLLASETRYRHTLEALLEGCQVIGFDWRYLYINDVADKHNRRPKEELLGRKYMDMWPGIESTPVFSVIRQCMDERTPQFMENEFRFPDGNVGWFELRINPVPEGIVIFSIDITYRKQAEEALRISEERFRFALANSPISVANLDRQLHYTWVYNPMAGYNPEDLVGKTVGLSTDPETKIRILKLLEEVLADGTTVEWETTVRTADGEKFFQSQAEPLRDSHGEIIGVALISIDITERKQAGELLRENEARLRQALNAAKAGIWEWDLQTNKNIWSQELWEVYGLEPYSSEPSYDAWLATIHPDDRVKAAQTVQEAAKNQTELNAEWRVIDKDGTQRWLMSRGQPIRNRAGQTVRFIGTVIDISRRKQAEEKVQRSEAMLRAILDQMPSGVTVRDARSGELVLSNTRSKEILSDLADTPAHFSHYRGFHLDGRPYRNEDWPLSRSIATGEVIQAEEINRQRSDETWITLSVNSAPVRDLQGQIIMGVAIFDDITERKQAEKQLQRTLEELKHSNAELEEFAYIASHDLQEPLRGIAGLTELLQRRYQGQLDSRADEYIGHIVDGTHRMQTLINDLLAYSRVGRRNEAIQTTEAEAGLQAALKNLNTAILEARATITSESLPMVKADGTQLTQLFQNLIGNALKFKSERTPQIHIGVANAGDCWQFSVRDNGIGIEPQYADRIFKVFQRLHTRREYQGTGIGLAICKKIIERHGGRIWVESEFGQGSTFYFTLSKARKG